MPDTTQSPRVRRLRIAPRRCPRSPRRPRVRGARLGSGYGRDGDEERARMSAVPITIDGMPRLRAADARARAAVRRRSRRAGLAARRHVRPRPPRPADLAHRPLLAALHLLHAGAGQRVARAVQHPDPRRDRASRAGRRGGGRHDVPPHRRRAAAARRHRRRRATARGDRGPRRRARRARDDDERHPAAASCFPA